MELFQEFSFLRRCKIRVAIAGCGIAGATTAFLLAEQGHHVTMFEQTDELRPVGAGIMLQTSGQQVLGRIGLLDNILPESSRLEGMTAMLVDGRPLVRLDFRRFDPEMFSLGVHRGVLMQSLLSRCSQSGVNFRSGFRAVDFRADRGELLSSKGDIENGFDLLVVADGSRSKLRSSLGIANHVKEYSYGALWTTGSCNHDPNRLFQVVEGTQKLVGLLPAGKGRSSYFWGLPVATWPALAKSDFGRWRDEAIKICPPSAQILGPLTGFHDLTFGTWRSVSVKSFFGDKTVLLGDAAHATSPHLGQGANLALEDAECLAECLSGTNDISRSLREFSRLRASKIRFYRQLGEILSPFFQSDCFWCGRIRNLVLPTMPSLPFLGRQMIYTLSGQKRGWLR